MYIGRIKDIIVQECSQNSRNLPQRCRRIQATKKIAMSVFSFSTQRRIVMLVSWFSSSGGVWVHELHAKYKTAFGVHLVSPLDPQALMTALTEINDMVVMFSSPSPHSPSLPFLQTTPRCLGTSYTADPIPRQCTWIPAAAGGYIVGKDGTGIRDIATRTGVYFYVDPALHESSMLQRVVFYPAVPESLVHTAIAALRQRLETLQKSYLAKQETQGKEEQCVKKYKPLTCFNSIWTW